MNTSTLDPATVDLEAVKTKQRAAWASGDYGTIGVTLQIVGETLCEAVDLRSGSKVLDVAAGNGNASLAAARRFAAVTSTDYVPSLLDAGRRRAEADRLPMAFQEADVEALPYADNTFDVVLSSFGVMFSPNHARAASEMLRVVRPQGRIGLANWTPRGFIGQMFGVLGRHVPPPAGLTPASKWGAEEYIEQLFRGSAADITTNKRMFTFRYRSVEHFIDVFRKWYGPVHKAFAGLSVEAQMKLECDMVSLIESFNRSGDSTMVVPSEYLEVVVVKR